jgi:hypothetical protein
MLPPRSKHEVRRDLRIAYVGRSFGAWVLERLCALRNKKGIYKRAMGNVSEHPSLNVTIAFCITKQNAHLPGGIFTHALRTDFRTAR